MSFVFYDEESSTMTVSENFERNVKVVEVRRENGRVQRVGEPFFRGVIIDKLVIPATAWYEFTASPLGAAMIPCIRETGLDIRGIYYKKLRKMKL